MPRPTGATAPRAVVLGIDAGTWDLLGPWIDDGLLPTLGSLREGGVSGPLRSTQPSSSPVIWTSIATGKTPEKHGIDWFLRFPEGVGKPAPVDRRMRKAEPLWRILGAKGFDVAVLGWFVTWPAEAVFGRLLTDTAHYGDVPDRAFPPSFLWDLAPVTQSEAVSRMKEFMDFDYDPARAERAASGEPSLDYLVFDRFVRAFDRDQFYLRAAERTLASPPLPDVLFLYLRGTDDVQHGFWKFMDPEPFGEVPSEQVAALGKVILRYWQWIDREVARLLAIYPAPPLVLVVSDHGAGPAKGEYAIDAPEYLHLSGAHRIDGILVAHGPGIRRGATVEGATIYDVAPTLLHALGLPVGADMDGRALTELFEDERATGPVATIPTYEGQLAPSAQGTEVEALPPDVDAKVKEHLRSLGYIE